jgi:NADH:ubiquinone oxidoreductase subunit E
MGSRIEMQICLGSSCFSRGNKEVVQFIKDWLRKNHLDDRVIFKGARCIGHCSNGPNLVINGKVIEGVGLVQVEKILEAEIGNLK